MAVAFGTTGAVITGTTSVDVAYPASIAAGDLLVLCVSGKYPENLPTTPSGWTLPSSGTASGGSGSPGAGTGTTYAAVYYKIATGSESGTLTLSVPSGNSVAAMIRRYTKGSGTWNVAACGGGDNTAGTSWSVTGNANPGITAGDLIVAITSVNNVSGVGSSKLITATGVTFDATVDRSEDNNFNGDDTEIGISEHAASSGTASAAPVFTMTRSATGTDYPAGATLMVRLREVAASTFGPQVIVMQ